MGARGARDVDPPAVTLREAGSPTMKNEEIPEEKRSEPSGDPISGFDPVAVQAELDNVALPPEAIASLQEPDHLPEHLANADLEDLRAMNAALTLDGDGGPEEQSPPRPTSTRAE